uniref:RNA-binding protein Nova-1-like n=1 Tax=Myxine glutinosa TaxID=7769 RepID=UPI00358ED664
MSLPCHVQENGSPPDTATAEVRKRPLEAEENTIDDGTINKKAFMRDGSHFSLKLLIPNFAVGPIMGKGGETITQLQRDTQTNIKLSKAHEYFPGTNERVALIQGSEDGLKQAHDLITTKMVESLTKFNITQPLSIKRAGMVKLVIPNSTAGVIIGKGGETVRCIMEESGARVQLSQKTADGSWVDGYGLERVVTVTGTEKQMHHCVHRIIDKVLEHPDSGSCLSISYGNMSVPSTNSMPTTPALPTVRPFDPYYGYYEDYTQAYQVNALPTRARTATPLTSETIPNSGAQASALPVTTNWQQQQQQHLQLQMKQQTDAVVQPMLIQAGFRGRDLQAASDAVGTLVNLGYSPTTLGLDWNLSIAAGAAVQAVVNDQATNAEEAETAASLETLRSDEVPADATSIEMAVPESIVGVIMGKGGRTLMDYQESTGTRIQLSRKGEFMPGTQNRRVTVWGPASARKVAEFLIKRRVAIEKYMRAASDR